MRAVIKSYFIIDNPHHRYNPDHKITHTQKNYCCYADLDYNQDVIALEANDIGYKGYDWDELLNGS